MSILPNLLLISYTSRANYIALDINANKEEHSRRAGGKLEDRNIRSPSFSFYLLMLKLLRRGPSPISKDMSIFTIADSQKQAARQTFEQIIRYKCRINLQLVDIVPTNNSIRVL